MGSKLTNMARFGNLLAFHSQPANERSKSPKLPERRIFLSASTKARRLSISLRNPNMVGIDIYRNPKNNLGCEDFTVSIEKINHRSIQLTFPEKYKDFVVSSHIPYVVKRSKSIKKKKQSIEALCTPEL